MLSAGLDGSEPANVATFTGRTSRAGGADTDATRTVWARRVRNRVRRGHKRVTVTRYDVMMRRASRR